MDWGRRVVCGIAIAAASFTASARADSITNGTFETGSFSGWTVTTGLDTGGFSLTNPDAGIIAGGVNTSAVVTPGSDPIVGAALNRVFEGSNAARINNNTTSQNVNAIKQTFNSSATDQSLTFSWAAVMQNPGHVFDDQPYFRVSVWDVTAGSTLFYDQLVYSNIAGTSWKTATPGVLYTDWKQFNIDISAVAGHALKLQFLASACSQGGHWGYAYVDGVSTTSAELPPTVIGEAVPLPGVALAGFALVGVVRAGRGRRNRPEVTA